MNGQVLNPCRVLTGPYASTAADGFNGAFIVPVDGDTYTVIASDGGGWKHVSVSRRNGMKPPAWDAMCEIKKLFFGDDEWAVQYHPAEADNINLHTGCLHLWQPIGVDFPKPPKEFV